MLLFFSSAKHLSAKNLHRCLQILCQLSTMKKKKMTGEISEDEECRDEEISEAVCLMSMLWMFFITCLFFIWLGENNETWRSVCFRCKGNRVFMDTYDRIIWNKSLFKCCRNQQNLIHTRDCYNNCNTVMKSMSLTIW